jgi:hypothetical protein
MDKKKQKHIDLENQRYGLFMDEESFDLDVMYGEHYLETDVNYFVLIHKVNIIESKKNDLYGQAKSKDKKYLPYVKINAMIDVADADGRYYAEGQGGISRDDTGNIRVSVYLNELNKTNLEIDRGDIVEWNQSGDRARYYEVESAQNVVDSTQQTIAGFKPYWKQIIATPVKEDVTPFLNGDSLR